MRYIFYADIYFIQNFMMKVVVLYLALYCNKIHHLGTERKWIGKICTVSFVGTIVEIIGLLFVNSYSTFVLCVHLLEVPLMVVFLLGKERQKSLWVIGSGYFFMVLTNGILEVFWNMFGEEGSYILYLLFSCGLVIVGVRIWRNYTKMRKGIYQVELIHQGRSMQLKGLYDSGNRLKDPNTRLGVHIIPADIWEMVDCSEKEPVYIPYQALGNTKGTLTVYYIDELIIENERRRINIRNCPLGVTKDNLFEGKNYEIILNEEVF